MLSYFTCFNYNLFLFNVLDNSHFLTKTNIVLVKVV
ncbi:Uncharacterised protein [Leminorella richardii]|uniref:Uncharacterized protein n=1 Tax=Leminorella richardii TaxID=158841 RepID=A0A2X4UM53_9GAMM|nr:Uncharacterised protein [Leminorella richardii]